MTVFLKKLLSFSNAWLGKSTFPETKSEKA